MISEDKNEEGDKNQQEAEWQIWDKTSRHFFHNPTLFVSSPDTHLGIAN